VARAKVTVNVGTENFMKFGLVVLEIGEQKDRPTDTLNAIAGANLKHCKNNNTIIVLRPFVRVSRYQKKHSTTHHPGHHPIFISFFHLYYTIHSILLLKLHAWQSFCTTSPRSLWSTSWSGASALHLIFHTSVHPISVIFSQQINEWLTM